MSEISHSSDSKWYLVAAASCWVKVVCFSVFHCAVGTLDILGCIIFCNDIERHDWCQRFEE